MTDFSESEEQSEIRLGVRRACSRFTETYWSEHDENHLFPSEFYEALAAEGWLGIAIPTEFGGGGMGIAEAAIVLEEAAASGAAMNGCSALHLSIFGMNPVVRFGTREMRHAHLPLVAQGKLHVAFGVTEPDAGTDTTSITTRAVRHGDSYVVRGRKVWMTKALHSQRALVLVRTTPLSDVEKRTQGLTLLLIDLQQPQVEIAPISKLGRNAVESCEVVFEDVNVPLSDRVGEEGRGFEYLLHGLNPERILVASEAIGIGRWSVQRAVRYGKERVVYGAPIGRNQGISFPLAEAYARLHAAALVVREAAWRYDRGLPCGEHANMAKLLAADAGFFAADRAMQTHGGFGYATEYHVGRYWKEARLMKLAPIPQEMVLNYLAEHVLGLPRSYGRLS